MTYANIGPSAAPKSISNEYVVIIFIFAPLLAVSAAKASAMVVRDVAVACSKRITPIHIQIGKSYETSANKMLAKKVESSNRG